MIKEIKLTIFVLKVWHEFENSMIPRNNVKDYSCKSIFNLCSLIQIAFND